MQKIILRNKKPITFFSFLLILTAFISNWFFGNMLVFEWALIVASIIGALPIIIQAIGALRVKVVSIDVLVTLAVLGAFAIKNYEEAAIVTFLFLFGAFLEERTLNKTRSAISELTQMAPETALKQMENGLFEEVNISQVVVGDILLVRTGAKIPVDGIVLSGEGFINQASITGESAPVEKQPGLNVFAGTLLENGTLQIKAEKVGEDTTFGKIIELVEEAQDSKSEAERFIDKFSKYYTPLVLILGILVGIIWQDISLAVTILVLGCPGALVIGVPVSNVAGIGNGARNGILLKGSEVINDFSKVDYIVFDKTGTLTLGSPQVTEVVYYTKKQEETLNYLLSVESESSHPLAKAIVNFIKKDKVFEVSNTNVVKGGGIIAKVNNKRVIVGNLALMKSEKIQLTKKMQEDVSSLEDQGNSIVLIAVEKKLHAAIGIKDKIRPNVKLHLEKLKKMGVKNLVLLSGDNQGTVNLVAKELGLKNAYGNMLPEDKASYIKKLKESGNIVAFVGDGVNDSPSLALSNIGIAMGSGTDVAIETSDVVLMNSDFGKLPHALGLVKATARNMKQNITLAVGVVLFLLANVLFSEWMNMSIGMLVHELSILVVILNGMRLLKFKLNKNLKKGEQ